MILADKIIEERKRNGWSQEELADQLDVSRQAVSKWESAGSIPDLDKIVKMAEIFGVSIDYLLKDKMVREAAQPAADGAGDSDKPVRKVSMEEANAFLDMKRKAAPQVANATSLCILSPVLVLILGVMSEEPKFHISEALAAGIGCPVMFAMIALAVYMFIRYGTQRGDLKYIEEENIETAYGVRGMAKERRGEYEPVFSRGIAIGVVFCIVSIIPLVIAEATESPDYVCGLFAGLMFLFIAIGVNLIIRVAMVKSGYDALLSEGDYTAEEKRIQKKSAVFSGVFWCVTTAVFLAWSLPTENWDKTWIVWPVAALLFVAGKGILRYIEKK